MERAIRPPEEDPVVLSPDTYTVPFENERVRILEVRLAPDATTAMHSHPAMVIYVLEDARVRFTYPNGLSEEVELSAGQAVWQKPVTHAAQNLGAREVRVLNIELKQ